MRLLYRALSLVIGIVLAATSLSAYAGSKYNMTQGVTQISREIYGLHMTIFWICCAIGVVVFGILIYSLINHRKSKGAVAADFHESVKVEIIWAVIPFIILIIMAIPATKVLIHMSDTSDADVNIKITGYQWKWQYEYLDQGISFFSNLATPADEINNKSGKNKWYLLEVDNPLVVPVHRKIRFLVTAKDVLHSWWVPALAVKRDAVPGFIHEAWTRIDKPGIYRGQCAELCGVHHGFMPIVVKAVSENEYKTWLAEKTEHKAKMAAAANNELSKEELMSKGEAAYSKTCAACHKPDGSGMPPIFPALKGRGMAVGPLAAHINNVLNGKPGTAMQAFGSQLDDVTLAAIITYERTAWGNDKVNTKYPTIVQPSDIIAARAKK